MASHFGWVDFAEEDRRRMLDVVSLFHERDIRDELGVGTIRDAFADYFFPGTSTIQTRARYFLFVPWVYTALEKRRVSSLDVGRRGREQETKLIYALLEAGEKEGVIGQDAKDRLKRLPSNVYWSGLGSWGIRMYPGSQAEYQRSLDRHYRKKATVVGSDDDEPAGPSLRGNWHPGLPGPPDGFPGEANLQLTYEEASYLRERVFIKHGDTLLAFLLDAKEGVDITPDFLWEVPRVFEADQQVVNAVGHARNFSYAMHGAAILYNLMLAETRGDEERTQGYREWLGAWAEDIEASWLKLGPWFDELEDFWSLHFLEFGRIPFLTRKFVDSWLAIALGEKAFSKIADHAGARDLIEGREFQIKRGRARLTNPRALEQWSGAAGTRQLDFRWAVVRAIIDDMLKGLGVD